jgi:hypothetical protein
MMMTTLAVDVADLATNAGSMVAGLTASIWVMHKFVVQPALQRIESEVGVIKDTVQQIQQTSESTIKEIKSTSQALAGSVQALAGAVTKLADQTAANAANMTRNSDRQCLVMEKTEKAVEGLRSYQEEWRLEQAKEAAAAKARQD